jgi:hypothetical protein
MLVARHRCSSLLIIALAVVANPEEILLEASMTAGGNMPLKPTQLTRLLCPTRWAAGSRTIAPRGGRRSKA